VRGGTLRLLGDKGYGVVQSGTRRKESRQGEGASSLNPSTRRSGKEREGFADPIDRTVVRDRRGVRLELTRYPRLGKGALLLGLVKGGSKETDPLALPRPYPSSRRKRKKEGKGGEGKERAGGPSSC